MVKFLFKASTAKSWMSFGHDRDYEQVFSTDLMQGRIRLLFLISENFVRLITASYVNTVYTMAL
jgi:hypothetical protein